MVDESECDESICDFSCAYTKLSIFLKNLECKSSLTAVVFESLFILSAMD